MKKTHLILLALVVAALVIRLIGLGSPSLRNDEGYSYFVAAQPLARFPLLLAEDVHPPLYYAFLHFWAKAGSSEFWLRLPNVLLSVLAIPLIFLVGKALASERVGLIAGALLAISQVMLRYSQNLRMYPLVVVFILLTAWSFLRWYASGRARFLAGFAVFAAMSLYTHYYAGFTILAIAAFVLVKRRFSWQFLFACLAVAMLFLPWLPILARQFSIKAAVEPVAFGGKLAWFGVGENNVFLRVALIFFQFSAGFLKANFHSLLFLALFAVAVVLFPYLLYLAARSSRTKKGIRSEILFLFVLAAVPMAVAIILWGFSIITPQTYARQVIVVMPFYILLVAVGLSKLKRFLWLAIAAVILLNAVAAYNYYVEDYHREDWKGASAFIMEGAAAGCRAAGCAGPAAGDGVILLVPDAYSHNFRHAYPGAIPAYGVLTRKSLAIGEFSQLAALQAGNLVLRPGYDACSYAGLAKGKGAVWFVVMNIEDRKRWDPLRACLEKEYAIAGSWENSWHDMWGASGVDVQVFAYRKINNAGGGTAAS